MVSYIVKVELLRSIAVYFFALIGFSVLLVKGSINVDLATYFLLAFTATVVHFSIMVWYRKRKEHAVTSKTPLPVTTPQPPQKPYRNLKIAIIAVLVYILYLYASVEHGLTQIFTWLVFIFLILSFGNIFLKAFTKELKYPFLRLLAFFFTMYIFIFMRDLVFGCYSIKPRFIILGAALMTYVVLSKLIGWVTKLFKTKVVHFLAIGFFSLSIGQFIGI
ncbi:MAG: hypothetical protein QMD22_04620 [archaeon]|nr:hypothetical protein [archaeon]